MENIKPMVPSAAEEEEQQLISWLNSVLEPSPATVQLLSNEAMLASKLIELGQPLLEDCRAMKRKLECNISWDRFVAASPKQLEWKLCVKRLLISYRKCWLKVALQVLKLLEEESAKPNATPKQSSYSSQTDLLQFLVSPPPNNQQKWAHASSVRFLTALFFLDRAKSQLKSLLPHQPSLFVVNEETEANKMAFKALTSSEQVLSQFVLTNLSAGLGAQFRAQLHSIAYSVHYGECHAEIAFEFSIKATAALSPVHLSDGIRFAKLTEVLFAGEGTSSSDLVKSLKYPAKYTADRTANMVRLFSSFLWARLLKYDTAKVWQRLDMQEEAAEVAKGYSRGATLRLLSSLRQVEQQLKLEQYFQPHLPAIVAVQRRFREKLETARRRKEFLRLRKATVVVQQQFRAQLAARKARSSYLQLKAAVQLVQKRFRLKRHMAVLKAHVERFVDRFRQAAITIQRHWRGASTRWRIEKQLLEGSSSTILGHSELMGLIASIELHAAIPSGPTLADKAEIAFGRLKTVAGKVNSEKEHFGAVLKNSVVLEKLSSDLYTLVQCAEISLEVRASILKKEQQQHSNCWSLLTFLATLLQHVNRSEEHKSLALTSLAFIHLLVTPIRMKSISVSIDSSVPSGTWQLLGETLLQLMHNYINYPLLLKAAMAICRQLVERGAVSRTTLLTESRLWVRLVERIKDKYQIDCACSSDSCDALADKCSCHLVKSEFRLMISAVGEQ